MGGEGKSMSEGEEGRKGEEAETADDRQSEGEEVEENEEREVAEGSGAEEAEGSMSEGEEIEGVKGVEAEGSKKVDEDSEVEGEEGGDSERELEKVEERDEEVSEGEEEPEMITEEEQDTGYLNAEEKVETEVVDVDDLPSDDKGSPTDERMTRRHSRQVKNAEEAPPASQLQKLRLRDEDGSDDDVSQVQKSPAGTRDVSPEVLEERYEAELKRKGKQEAKAHKKKPRQASRAVVIEEPTPETIRVPFAAAAGEESKQKETEEETENPPEEEGVYEKMEVLVTKRLLETMVQFSDPKQTKECGGRVGNGKVAKSGKSLCLSDLRDLGAEEKFISYFNSIGFEWLLDHCDEEVPVPLAKGFFTSFRFKPTTDPDVDSITFRLFNQEMEMSIREWSLRMGLFTLEEDEEGTWNEREIGPPKKAEGFAAEDAWKVLTHRKGGKFKTSYSKGIHIADPILRLAQVYIGYNLLGQVAATITTPELYFMWCMLKGVKVHLGYWMAMTINAVRTRTDRHLYTCNLLGAYIKRNVAMTIADSVTHLPLCNAPGSFDLPFFFNKGLTTIRDGVVAFYEVGKQEAVTVKTEKEETEVKVKDADDGWKARMEEMVVSQKGMMTVQTEKLTQAVDVMMKMYTLFEKRMMSMTPTESSQRAPGTSKVKQVSSTPAITPTQKAKGTTTTASVPVKKENPRPAGQKARKNDEPAPPPPKRTKTIARKSGPQGDQSQN